MSQAGSIRKRGETWTAYWFVRNAEGERVQRSKGGFRTKGDARDHLTEVLRQVQTGTWTEPKRVTLTVFLREQWLPSLDKRPSTIASYTTTVEKWIIPHLGALLVPAIRPADIQRGLAALRASGGKNGKRLGDRSVQYAYTILRMALSDAVAHGFIQRNPASAVKRPQARSAEMKAWTADEAASFLDSTATDRYYAAWVLYLQRGFRRGELAGLRWADVDLDARQLSVRHTRVMVNAKAETSEPKTSSGRRSVPLSPRLVTILRQHRTRQSEERLAWGEAWTDSGYVFTREDGTPPPPEFFSTAFEAAVGKSGLRPIRLHDLRHICATLALQAGEKTEVVSKWLGHASPSITQDIYQHVIPSMIEDAGERLDEIVFSRRAN